MEYPRRNYSPLADILNMRNTRVQKTLLCSVRCVVGFQCFTYYLYYYKMVLLVVPILVYGLFELIGMEGWR